MVKRDVQEKAEIVIYSVIPYKHILRKKELYCNLLIQKFTILGYFWFQETDFLDQCVWNS